MSKKGKNNHPAPTGRPPGNSQQRKMADRHKSNGEHLAQEEPKIQPTIEVPMFKASAPKQTLWQRLASWPVVGAITFFVASVGVGLMSTTPPEFAIAKFCFAVSAVILLAKVAHELATEKMNGALRMLLAFVAFGTLGMLVVGAWHWVNHRRQQWATKSQDNQMQQTTQLPQAPAPEPQTKKLERTAAPKEQHTPPTFTEQEGPFTVLFGSSNIKLVTAKDEVTLLHMGGKAVARAYVDQDRLYIDATLSNGFGGSSVELKHNKLTFNDQRLDRNYDDSALEIVNKDLIPIFQLIYRNPRAVIVRGIFAAAGQIVVADENSIVFNPAPGQIVHFKRIFKYPSRLYKGQEAEGGHQ